jgi:FAD/FMN-containing dehydrogenase
LNLETTDMADDVRTSLEDAMQQAVGPANVSADPALTALMSQDIWAKGADVSLVIAPGTVEEVSRAVAAATREGRAIAPRGGGMSYTSGYTQTEPGAVLIDMRRMNRILEVNEQDMYVTVEAGATWIDLFEACKAKGVRTPFWGPLSGLSSTIGGGLSQNNAFFGAGTYGTTAESVTSITVVLADGSIVRTGTAGQAGASPFFRHYGPDFAGLFLGDTGAFGVKTEATLRLIRMPEHEAWASFSFQDRDACARAMAETARTGAACELFGFDPNLARVRMKRASLLADAGALLKVVGAQKSLFQGLKEGAKIALAGRGFLDGADYSLHVVIEGRSKAAVEADLALVRRVMSEHGAKEVENTIPKVIRANPYAPLNSVLGPGGERWVPVHGIVRHSDGPAAWAALDALFAEMAAEFDAHEISFGYLVTTLSTNGFLIEPVFFWPEARFALHEATVEPSFLAKLPALPDNPAATAIVAKARKRVVDVFTRFGGAHFQVGRTYPLAATRTPEALALLETVKSALDPQRRMNPGVLGLT